MSAEKYHLINEVRKAHPEKSLRKILEENDWNPNSYYYWQGQVEGKKQKKPVVKKKRRKVKQLPTVVTMPVAEDIQGHTHQPPSGKVVCIIGDIATVADLVRRL